MEPLKTLNPALKSSPGNMANKLEQISTSIHKTIDKMSDATLPAVDRVASGAHQAVNKLADAAETIGAKPTS